MASSHLLIALSNCNTGDKGDDRSASQRWRLAAFAATRLDLRFSGIDILRASKRIDGSAEKPHGANEKRRTQRREGYVEVAGLQARAFETAGALKCALSTELSHTLQSPKRQIQAVSHLKSRTGNRMAQQSTEKRGRRIRNTKRVVLTRWKDSG